MADGSVILRFSNVDLAALNTRLGNVSTVSLEAAIMELVQEALGPEHDPHSGAVTEPAIDAHVELVAQGEA
ncbi:hypothetical protein vBCbaSRXM_70 [Citromicrobium phage vB_CbaS-RXM]|nr:hypothetical protein vBCbaSRXM_70 [Citromicrobium phage vB_CbaS-RXM]